MNLFNTLFNRFLPQTCSCCASLIHYNSLSMLCEECRYALPWLGDACLVCAIPLADCISSICGQCIKDPPDFSSAKIPFRYDYPLDRIILDFKFQQQLSKCKTLSHLMLDYLHDEYQYQQLPEALVPVPMYWKRQFKRGFNQSEQLAHALGKFFQLPVLSQVCFRKHHKKAQKDSDKHTRENNLRNAFSVNDRTLHLIKNKHLALIDDVVTTGATVREVSKLLIKQGAASVVVWALARTPRPN